MTTLSLQHSPPGRVDLRGVLPTTLTGLSARQIAALSIRLDGRPLALGELFSVSATGAEELRLVGDCSRLDHVGHGLAAGHLRVEGPVGHYAGFGLAGGELVIEGPAGDYAACAMRGGLLRILGSAGQRLGAPLTGERQGLSGGVVAVNGNVGDYLGERMRRGLILVGGRAGLACGARMLAGSLVVAGGCGPLAGFGLRRGSLILGRTPADLLPTFNDAGVAEYTYLALLHRHAEAILPGVLPAGTRLRRLQGDLAWGGKGEILVPA
jgi:formylmethanofuran dehydrogenase subunit C